MIINSNKTQHLASMGLQKMKEAPDRDLMDSRGDAFLTSIRDHAGNEQDRLLAEMVQKSVIKAKEQYRSADTTKMQKLALSALANGTGPIGSVLAELGKVACSHSSDVSDIYFEGIKQYGTENQKSVIEFLEKTGFNGEAKELDGYRKLVFKALEDTEETDVEFVKKHGSAMMSLLVKYSHDYECDEDYAKEVGNKFIELIAEKGDGKEKEFAMALKEANISSIYSQEVAMKFITGGIEPTAKGALLKLLHKTADPELFNAMFKDTGDPAILSVIENVSSIDRTRAYHLVPDALKMMQNEGKLPVEKNLLALNNKFNGSFSYSRNGCEVDEAFLKVIAEKADIPENRKIARKALAESKESPGFFKSIFQSDYDKNQRKKEIYTGAFGAISKNCTAYKAGQDNLSIQSEINNIVNS